MSVTATSLTPSRPNRPAIQKLNTSLMKRRSGGQQLLTVLIVMVAVGCVVRLLIDDTLFNAPAWAAAVLALVLVVLCILNGVHTGLLAFLLMPALFGAAPWNSPVRASLGGVDLPLYLFDLIIMAAAIFAFARGLLQSGNVAGDFLRSTSLLLVLVVAMLAIKISGGGLSGDTLRNAALFYYFPAICLTAALVANRLDIKSVVPWTYLRVLGLSAFAPVIVLLGVALGAHDIVLVSIHQGMVEPAGVLAWLPPGSLVLLSFCSAAFLFDRSTAIHWKLVIVVLLVFDLVTYFNRAMWMGIMVGVAIHWVVLRGWRRGVLPAMAVIVALMMTINILRDVAREGHNESSEWRLLAWGLTAASIVEQPLLGHPYNESLLAQVLAVPDSLYAMGEANLVINPVARSPHNSYLSLLFFGGFLQGGAVILFVLLTLAKLGRGIVRMRRSGERTPVAEAVFRGAIAVAVYAGFNVVLETPIEGITFWIVIFTAWLWARELKILHRNSVN